MRGSSLASMHHARCVVPLLARCSRLCLLLPVPDPTSHAVPLSASAFHSVFSPLSTSSVCAIAPVGFATVERHKTRGVPLSATHTYCRTSGAFTCCLTSEPLPVTVIRSFLPPRNEIRLHTSRSQFYLSIARIKEYSNRSPSCSAGWLERYQKQQQT